LIYSQFDRYLFCLSPPVAWNFENTQLMSHL